MIRLILTLAAFSLTATTLRANELHVAHELSTVALSKGQTLEVVGRIDSLLGSLLELQGTDAKFQLDDATARKTLRLDDPEAPIMLRGVVRGTKPDLVVDVDHVEEAPEPQAIADRLKVTSPLRNDRELARLSWFLAEAGQTATLGSEIARDRFLVLLKTLERGDKTSNALVDLLELTQETLGETDPWIEGAGRIANRFGSQREFADRFRALGFVIDGQRWRLEREVLHDLGLVRDVDSIITVQRKELRERADLWYTNSSSVALLRSLPDNRYEAAARRGELKNGMSRLETLRAKGYPLDVTFEYREGHQVEAWNYTGGALFFCDGLLFDSRWD